jgi:hypothetical protein
VRGLPSGQLEFTLLLRSIYESYCPEKSAKIPELVAKFKGREGSLLGSLATMYSMVPKIRLVSEEKETAMVMDALVTAVETRNAKMTAESLAGGRVESSGAVVETVDPRKVEGLLRELYSEHNPEKLGKVRKIASSFSGSERKLVRKLVDKYSFEQQKEEDMLLRLGLPVAPPDRDAFDMTKVSEGFMPLIDTVNMRHNNACRAGWDELLAFKVPPLDGLVQRAVTGMVDNVAKEEEGAKMSLERALFIVEERDMEARETACMLHADSETSVSTALSCAVTAAASHAHELVQVEVIQPSLFSRAAVASSLVRVCEHVELNYSDELAAENGTLQAKETIISTLLQEEGLQLVSDEVSAIVTDSLATQAATKAFDERVLEEVRALLCGRAGD